MNHPFALRADQTAGHRPAAIVTPDGLNLAYEDWGVGAPMVFAHSWAMQSAMWSQQIPALTDQGFRCIAYDRRGHGRSQGHGGGYDIDTLADDLAAVLDQLNLQDVTLVGHSMGGCEAVRYLSRHGAARVSRVVMLAPITPFLLQTPDNPLGLDQAMLTGVRAIWRQDFAGWVADNAAPFFTAETPAQTVDWMARMLLQCPLMVALATHAAVAEVDFRPDLAKISLPVLIIQGDADQSAPLDLTGRPSAAMIAGARLTVLPGAPHGLFITHAAAVNQAIAEFAKE